MVSKPFKGKPREKQNKDTILVSEPLREPLEKQNKDTIMVSKP